MGLLFQAADNYSGPGTTQTTHNKSVTVPAGCTLAVLHVSNTNPADTATITATLGGVGMTIHATRARTTIVRGTVLYILNPTAGAAACNVTAAIATRAAWGIVFYSGSLSGTPLRTEVQNDGSSSTPSLAGITSAVGEFVLNCVATNSGSTADLTGFGGGETSRVNVEANAGGGANAAICGISEKAGAASVSVSATTSIGVAWVDIGFSIQAAPTPGGGRNPLTGLNHLGGLQTLARP